MPKLKALLITVIVLTMAVFLFGCDLLASRSTGPEEVITGQEGELPEWLLFSYRSVEASDSDEDPLLPKERDNDEELDEDQDAAADPEQAQDQPPAVTQPDNTADAPAQTEIADRNDEPKPGTIEWIAKEKERRESQTKPIEEEEEEEDDGDWFNLDTGQKNSSFVTEDDDEDSGFDWQFQQNN